MLKIKQIRNKKGLTLDELASKSGISKRMISGYEAGTSDITLKKLQDIATALEVGLNELVDGFKSDKTAPNIAPNIAPNPVSVHEQKVNYHTKVLPIQVDQDNNERIVYVPISARAGYKVGFSDPIYIEKLPSFNLPGHTHGTFRAFQVSGFSMYPTFNDNDIAIGQYVERVEHVYNNRVYLIVSKEDVLLKRVRLSISTKEIILLSDSEEFEPITVPFKEIKEIWCVTDKITKNMAPPSELEARVAKLEQKLSKIKR